MANTYELSVKSGNTLSENGYFFVAGSFSIQTEKTTVTCEFKRDEELEVAYFVYENGKEVLRLEHPDYILPNVAPESLDETFTFPSGEKASVFFAALSKVGVIRSKTYNRYFATEEHSKSFSYSVSQKPVL